MTSSPRRTLHEPGAGGFLRRSLFVTMGQGSVALLFIVYIFAARLLGDAAFGEFSLGMAIAAVLFILPSWGSSRYSAIVAARDPDRTEEIVATYLGLTLPLVVFYFPLVGFASLLITGNPTVVAVALLLGLDELVRELGNGFRLLFRVHDEYPLETLTSFAERGGIILAASTALILAPNPVILAGAFAGGRAVGSVVTVVYFRHRIGRIGVHLRLPALRRLLRAGTPLAIRRAIGMLTFRVDMLFLGAMRSSQEVGWYGSIYTIMDGAVMAPHAVNGAFGPTISASYAEGRLDTVRRLYRRGLKYLVLVGLFLGGGLALVAEPFVGAVFGREYLPAAPGLTILALAIPFVFVRSLATEVLDNVDLRNASMKMFGVALLLNVVLNLFLIPRYGFLGAASSTVATEAYLAASMILVLNRAGYDAKLLDQVRGPLLAGLASALVVVMLRDFPTLGAGSGALTYLIGLTLFGTWDEKDRDLLRQVLRRFRNEEPPER